jgi:hypothetical protein
MIIQTRIRTVNVDHKFHLPMNMIKKPVIGNKKAGSVC